MADDFERAVALTCNPSAPESSRAETLRYFDSIRQHPEGWRFCLEKFFSTSSNDVRFYCLQLIHLELNNNQINAEIGSAIREALLSSVPSFIPNAGCNATVLNKYAQLLVGLACLLQPSEWPAFFDKLLADASTCEASLDMIIRVLRFFQEDLVEAQQQQQQPTRQQQSQQDSSDAGESKNARYVSAVKDAMRVRTTSQLAQLWFAVLRSFSDSKPDLVKAVLGLIESFEEWIPAQLIANEHFIPLLFRFMQTPRYAEEACDCVAAVAEKGMDPVAKIELLANLRIQEVVTVVSVDDSPSLLLRLGNLLASSCSELLLAAEKLFETNGTSIQTGTDSSSSSSSSSSQTSKESALTMAESLFNQLMRPLIIVLSHSDDEISASAFPVMLMYLTQFKGSFFKGTPNHEHLSQLLPVVMKKIAYPSDFFSNHEPGDEDEDFEETRKRFSQLFRAIVKLDPDYAINFVASTLSDVCVSKKDSSSVETIESALYLFFLFGEGLSDITQQQQQQTKRGKNRRKKQQYVGKKMNKQMQGEQKKSNGESTETDKTNGDDGSSSASVPLPVRYEPLIKQIILTLATNGFASTSSHYSVLLTFFECAVRYSKELCDVPQAITLVLQTFLDERGIRHRVPVVRRQVSLLFQRFLRQMNETIHPFAQEIVQGLQPVLALRYEVQQIIPFDDQLALFECVGYILGSRPPKQVELLRQFMEPLLTQLCSILSNELYRQDTLDKPWYRSLIKQHLQAITVVSKGFSLQEKVKDDALVAQVFTEVLRPACTVLQVFSSDQTVWMQVATFLHRFVDALGVYAVAFVGTPLEQLCRTVSVCDASHCSQQDQQIFFRQLSELMSLVAQVVGRYHEKAAGTFEDVLAQVITYCTTVISPALSQATVGSEEARELFEMNKLFVQCLSVIAREAPGMLLTHQLGSKLAVGLKYVVEGSVSPDIAHRRSIVRVMSRLVDTWCGKDRVIGFAEFVAETVVPVFMHALVAGPVKLTVTDGTVSQYIGDLARFLVQSSNVIPAVCEQLRNNDYSMLTSTMACTLPTEAADSFIQALATQKVDIVAQALKYFVQLNIQQQQQAQQQPPLLIPPPIATPSLAPLSRTPSPGSSQ